MTLQESICIADFTYNLPGEKIAAYPLHKRDTSKLLICKAGIITESKFRQLPDYLPEGCTMVFNDTRVVRARLIFNKPTGARIEVFCLEEAMGLDVQVAFAQQGAVEWKCLVGNAKRWQEGTLTRQINSANGEVELSADLMSRTDDAWLIRFSWQPQELSFSEVLEMAGQIPLPPYINREAEDEDSERYQTVYARSEGSVAAPTAGLHFSEELLGELQQKKIKRKYVTLHVGAGTFKPVSTDMIGQHRMHRELITINKATICALLNVTPGSIFAVGTTSLRALESLYWHGVKLIKSKTDGIFEINQWDPYHGLDDEPISTAQALEAILHHLEETDTDIISGYTSLIIVPGYRFRMCQGLITNFHQPQSTLLLLVAAFIGPVWRQVYEYALTHDFRFLSYGDGCLFFLNNDAQI
jgi:S-adenosylmethionine:tRNA ribosyltransferase-isomerase